LELSFVAAWIKASAYYNMWLWKI